MCDFIPIDRNRPAQGSKQISGSQGMWGGGGGEQEVTANRSVALTGDENVLELASNSQLVNILKKKNH